MAIAFSLVVAAVGMLLILKGWKGYSWQQLVTSFQTGRKPS